MDTKLISAIDLASELGVWKQTIIKEIDRLQIEGQKMSTSDSRGQKVLHITEQDAERVRAKFSPPNAVPNDGDATAKREGYILAQDGVFYVIQLEPEYDPGRFKVGFTTDLDDRLRKHRCSAPHATVLRTWACKSLWERTAIDCVAAGCERLYTPDHTPAQEVFRTASIDDVIDRCERFFELMPK